MAEIKKHIYTVSELNSEIKSLLEKSYPFVWISAEVSNFRIPASGHYYFSLKDARSQISAVMFRAQNKKLKFELEDGMSVTGFGRVSVYEPRGAYQIILEYLEPKGIGALQVAFEQLKQKLADEGLFDEKHKKPLPFLPSRLALITSATGAVVHDILNVAGRRFPNLDFRILPVKVQGEGAEEQIVAAIKALNRHQIADLAILARGGGSLEDLQAFNSEAVARAIFESKVPIISAVGHETDFTIADFVADMRAPTPSAAAEIAVPIKSELNKNIKELQYYLINNINRYIKQKRQVLAETRKRLVDPKRRIQDARLKLDDISSRFSKILLNYLHRAAERLRWRTDHLIANSPARLIQGYREKLKNSEATLNRNFQARVLKDKARLGELNAKLDAFNPNAILLRGYSITRTLPDRTILRSADAVAIGQDVEIVLAKGSLQSRIKRITKNGETDV